MATRGGRISLPLAVGVDCGHPRPSGVDHSNPLWPDLFFFGWFTGSLPLAVGVDRGHPQWPDLSFFFFFSFRRKSRRRWVAGGGVHHRRWEGIIYLVA
jgi:hypothetical protein